MNCSKIVVFPCISKYNHPVAAHFLRLDHGFSEQIKSTIEGPFFSFFSGAPFMIYLYDKVAQGNKAISLLNKAFTNSSHQ